MYIVTSRDKHGSDMIIYYFKSYENAFKEYRQLKKLKYKRVNISKTI